MAELGGGVAVSYSPTEETELLRSTARQFLEDRLPIARVREIMMSDEGLDRATWQELAGLGWAGLAIPEAFGGAGYGYPELAVLAEEMGRMVTPGPFLSSAVLATELVLALGSESEKADLLPRLADGSLVATAGLYERSNDWSLDASTTVAMPDGDGWTVSGTKRYVIEPELSDVIIVPARVGGVDGEPGVFVVPLDAGGVTVELVPTLDATRRQGDVRMDAVHIDAAARLTGGDVASGLRRALDLTLTFLASEQLGGAQRCIEMSVGYAKERYQFGRPIGSFQAIKHRCAEMLVEVEKARTAAMYAARVTDDPTELSLAAAMAASVCSEAYRWVSGENIQVHGGIGFTWEHDAHLYFKRAKATSLLFGSPAHHRSRLADMIGI